MRIIGLFVMCVWLVACTTPPMFPPEIMKDVESDTSAFKSWKEQTSYPSDAPFVSHKVELEGKIMKVIPKAEGVVIVVDGYLIDQPDSKDVKREDLFRFAIDFDGIIDSGMLQTGNRLVVVGATDRAGLETIGWMPEVLPNLRAQCLHVWKSQGVKNMYFSSSGYMGYYAPEERTFCREESIGRPLSTGSQSDGKKGLAGS